MSNRKCIVVGQGNVNFNVKKVRELQENFEELILHGVKTFYFSRKNKFVRLSLRIVSSLMEKYDGIQRITLLNNDLQKDILFKRYIKFFYEDYYILDKINERNNNSFEKINEEVLGFCDVLVCYYNDKSKKEEMKSAYEFALKSNKKIINMA